MAAAIPAVDAALSSRNRNENQPLNFALYFLKINPSFPNRRRSSVVAVGGSLIIIFPVRPIDIVIVCDPIVVIPVRMTL